MVSQSTRLSVIAEETGRLLYLTERSKLLVHTKAKLHITHKLMLRQWKYVVVCMYCVALYVLYPYLTIHMRELGISVEEAAIMSAVTPIVAIIMPPIAGVVADRIGNFKVLY